MTAAEVDELVGRYNQGETVRELAQTFRVHRATVSAQLERRGVARRVNVAKLSPIEVAEAARLRSQGWSLAAIGRNFGVHPATVLRALRRN
jgi:IS30 family transposase